MVRFKARMRFPIGIYSNYGRLTAVSGILMQYCDVITNPRWRTAAILKIVKSPYLNEKSSDFDEI